jgi:hypothetical protein
MPMASARRCHAHTDGRAGPAPRTIPAVFDPGVELLSTVLLLVVADPRPDGIPNKTWDDARAALAASGETAEDIRAAVAAEDGIAVRAILEEWASGRRPLVEHDREVLRRAMKAFRKRLKVTLLDAESSIAGGPMSSGRRSTIIGIAPPERWARDIWDELVRQGQLRRAGRGTYELPPGAPE